MARNIIMLAYIAHLISPHLLSRASAQPLSHISGRAAAGTSSLLTAAGSRRISSPLCSNIASCFLPLHLCTGWRHRHGMLPNILYRLSSISALSRRRTSLFCYLIFHRFISARMYHAYAPRSLFLARSLIACLAQKGAPLQRLFLHLYRIILSFMPSASSARVLCYLIILNVLSSSFSCLFMALASRLGALPRGARAQYEGKKREEARLSRRRNSRSASLHRQQLIACLCLLIICLGTSPLILNIPLAAFWGRRRRASSASWRGDIHHHLDVISTAVISHRRVIPTPSRPATPPAITPVTYLGVRKFPTHLPYLPPSPHRVCVLRLRTRRYTRLLHHHRVPTPPLPAPTGRFGCARIPTTTYRAMPASPRTCLHRVTFTPIAAAATTHRR